MIEPQLLKELIPLFLPVPLILEGNDVGVKTNVSEPTSVSVGTGQIIFTMCVS